MSERAQLTLKNCGKGLKKLETRPSIDTMKQQRSHMKRAPDMGKWTFHCGRLHTPYVITGAVRLGANLNLAMSSGSDTTVLHCQIHCKMHIK